MASFIRFSLSSRSCCTVLPCFFSISSLSFLRRSWKLSLVVVLVAISFLLGEVALSSYYLVPAVLLDRLHHCPDVFRFGVIHSAARTQDKAAVLADYLDELLAMLFDVLSRTDLE